MKSFTLLSLFASFGLATIVFAQTPKQIVIQAANVPQSAPAAPTQNVTATGSDSVMSAIKSLEQVKAANAETLKRQEDVLEKLDDLKKAADQLRIFAKRG